MNPALKPHKGSKQVQRFRAFFLVIGLVPWLSIYPFQLPISGIQEQNQFKENLAQATAIPGQTIAPTPTPSDLPVSRRRIELVELGYDTTSLKGPQDSVDYIIRVAENWQIAAGSYLELDFDFLHTWLDPLGEPTPYLGQLTISLDDELQETLTLDATGREHIRQRINLSPELLNDQDREHTLTVALDTTYLCNDFHRTQILIHPTSSVNLVYDILPLDTNLGRFPSPFYQNALEPDVIHFVLPAEPTPAELQTAATLAAQLGRLTSNRILLEATTDRQVIDDLATGLPPAAHLFVLGRPDRNRLIPWLSAQGALPVLLRERRMTLSVRGPATAPSDHVLAYTLALTNTTGERAPSLWVDNNFSIPIHLLDCRPSCEQISTHTIRWNLADLGPGETVELGFSVRPSAIISQEIPLENVVTLSAPVLGPVNTNTSTTTLTFESSSSALFIPTSGDLFVYQDQAVAETDGILQEIVAPWDNQWAILVVTGLSDAAVNKAVQSLDAVSRLPDFQGPVALVRHVPSTLLVPTEPAIDLTLADLGQGDRILYGLMAERTFSFDIPFSWDLTDEAYFELIYSYSQNYYFTNSALTILLNGAPVASTRLDELTVDQKTLRVNLPRTQIRPGSANKLTVRAQRHFEDKCVTYDPQQVWFTISQESSLHLPHQTRSVPLDLSYFPLPLGDRAEADGVVIVLPDVPNRTEIEASLRLAGLLGSWSDAGFAPGIVFGQVEKDERLLDAHIIALGRPSTNAILRQVNDVLPQPFWPETDEIRPRSEDIVLRLPQETSLGYVQEIVSPWNKERALLAVTGTTDEGVAWAIQLLIDPTLRRQMGGDLALIRGEEVQSTDTRELTLSGAASTLAAMVPVLTSTVTTTLSPSATLALTPTATTPVVFAPRPSTPSWLLPMVGTAGLAVIAIVGAAVWQTRRRRAPF
jgi:hypothetical protein